MGLFKRKKEEMPEPERVIVGIKPELIERVADKIKNIKEERNELRLANESLTEQVNELTKEKSWLDDKIDALTTRVSTVEVKCTTVDESFKAFQGELKSSFLDEARRILKELIRGTESLMNNIQSRLIRFEDDLINMKKELDDFKFITSFNDHLRQVSLCTAIMSNADSRDHALITLLLQTIHTLVNEMREQGLWTAAKDSVITSLLTLKSRWRSKDERIEGLIGMEINMLESLM